VLDPSVPTANNQIYSGQYICATNIKLKIFAKVAQFSYFPPNEGTGIDGTFKVTPATG